MHQQVFEGSFSAVSKLLDSCSTALLTRCFVVAPSFTPLFAPLIAPPFTLLFTAPFATLFATFVRIDNPMEIKSGMIWMISLIIASLLKRAAICNTLELSTDANVKALEEKRDIRER